MVASAAPIAPKSATTWLPATMALGLPQTPVVMMSPARSAAPCAAWLFAIHASAARGSPRASEPAPVVATRPSIDNVTRWAARSIARQSASAAGPSTNSCVQALSRRELGAARAGEIREPGVRKLDGRMQCGHRREHFIDRPGVFPGRKIAAHHERELRFRDRHAVRSERHLARAVVHTACEQPSRDGAVDVDVALPAGARGRDLPAEDRLTAGGGERALRRVAFGHGARPARIRQRLDDFTGGPAPVDDPACFVRLLRFHGHARSLDVSSSIRL